MLNRIIRCGGEKQGEGMGEMCPSCVWKPGKRLSREGDRGKKLNSHCCGCEFASRQKKGRGEKQLKKFMFSGEGSEEEREG